jgi:hypothetical protein
LFNTYFDDISDVSQAEMNGIVNALSTGRNEIENVGDISNFYVYRLDRDDMYRLVSFFISPIFITIIYLRLLFS